MSMHIWKINQNLFWITFFFSPDIKLIPAWIWWHWSSCNKRQLITEKGLSCCWVRRSVIHFCICHLKVLMWLCFNRCNHTCAMIQFNRQYCVHDSVLSWHCKQKIASFYCFWNKSFLFFVKCNKVLFIKVQEKKVSNQKSTLYLWWIKPMFTTPSAVQTFCWLKTRKNPACNIMIHFFIHSGNVTLKKKIYI